MQKNRKVLSLLTKKLTFFGWPGIWMDVRETRCSMASYSNRMSVPIILHTLLVSLPVDPLVPLSVHKKKTGIKNVLQQLKAKEGQRKAGVYV